jgi:hypothetical protein
MNKEQMKKFANAFCRNTCGADKMFECDCFQTSCEELAFYLSDVKDILLGRE